MFERLPTNDVDLLDRLSHEICMSNSTAWLDGPRGRPTIMTEVSAAEFHCYYAADRESALQKGKSILPKFERYLRPGRVVDLGCGEGGLLLALKELGRTELSGVESNQELSSLAKSFGLPIICKDLLAYLQEETLRSAVYFYIDVMEHVPFELNLRLLASLPVGSRLILQTPNTESVLGHQYFMNVPSHVAPYSPWVIRKMLARFGYDVAVEGTVDGAHPRNWKNRVRAFFIRLALGLAPEIILGGGNYFVVADKVGETNHNRHE
jgi:SAM-dependent methyltransferase